MPSPLQAWRQFRAIRPELMYYSAAAAKGAPSVQRRDFSAPASKLPKLPVPDGIHTLKHFLDFAEAIESPKEFKQTLKTVQTFADAEMLKLDSALAERAKKHNNWLTPWWLNVAYLESRDPLPVVTSPGVNFPKFEYQGQTGQLDHAAKIAQAAIFFYKKIQRGELKQDMAGSAPLDMAQYRLLFGTSRVPKKDKDEIRYGADAAQSARHAAVFRNGHAFRMDVVDRDGDPLSLDTLRQQLDEIVSASENRNLFPLGCMTAEKRDKWAEVRESVGRLPSNRKSLDTIESALFTLAIDGPAQPLKGFTERDEQARQSLHGSGSERNSVNRWFDKTVQFIIGDNGYCGMCYEHTPAEGPPVATLMDFVMDQFDGRTFIAEGTSTGLSPVRRLDFELTNDHKKAIEKAKRRIDAVAEDLEVLTYTFTRFGKNFPKSVKVSPDSFIQLAFALAFHRIHGTLAPTYETASLRKFDEGRTENIRGPNLQTAKFCQMMKIGNRPFVELHEQLHAAIAAHKKYTADAMNGAGMDRHLLAWRLLAAEKGLPLPSILDTSAYKRMAHYQVSTSQVPTRHYIPMCFGPSADDCYGICYNPQEKELHFTITTFQHFPSTSSKRFAKELERALNDLRAICVKGAKEHSKL
ncbi:hypothetical protein PRIPAC_72846 [Pristionchus pacificus]|uniref:Carn_acyltransf domain-containing protein n=1 Tax=Pristionchus pacificus TaxID=54126 RepID=A0A2A6BGM6_PRIPA|nr:hypothetical protein PRIPAC_72846 [Pristionchus pacificus]|eukprot:PDM65013.1 hypothetical protein PRIPAC_53269 [Pristionchus pacificus]